MRRLFAALLLCFMVSGATFAAVDEELLSLVSPDATIVASIDVRQAKNSRFGQYVLNRMSSEDRGFQELIQRTGFDPRRDLQHVVFATSASDNNSSKSSFAAIVRGNFDQARIRAMAKSKGASMQNYRGNEVFVDKFGNDTAAYTFTNPDVLVMGDLAMVQQILSNRLHSGSLDPRLQQLITEISTNNDAWFASVMPGSDMANRLKQADSQPAAEQAVNSILQSSGGIHFGDAVRFSLDAIARSPKDAQSVSDVIKFLVTLAQMNRQNGSNAQILATAADEMTLETDGNAVHMSISVPETSLEQLANGGAIGSFHDHSRDTHR